MQRLVAVLILSSIWVCVAEAATCSSTTDEFIHRYITIPQKPLDSILVQRFVGPELSISCLSVVTAAGATCTQAALPRLCYRAASDTLASLTCEYLSDYMADANAKVTRGSRSGPDMVWVIQLDTTNQPASCFARTEEVRLLAFVRGNPESSIALFVILLIVVVVVVVVAALLIAFSCYQRSSQLDSAGAIAVAGPKMNYLGSQIHAAEPQVLNQNIKHVLLPVRASAGVEDLTTAYRKVLMDPNYDPSTAEGGRQLAIEQGRAPSSVRRILRASPPKPGDGQDDGQLQRYEEMRRMAQLKGRSQRRGSRGGGSDIDDGNYSVFGDAFGRSSHRGFQQGSSDEEYSSEEGDQHYDPTNLMDVNDPNGGEIVYDSAGRAIGRRRKHKPRRALPQSMKGGGRRDVNGSLFPTQDGWRTIDGQDEENSDEEYDELGGGRGSVRGGGKGNKDRGLPGFDGGPNGQGVKFIPQWMYGNFGRGGIIPEVLDTTQRNTETSGYQLHDGTTLANPLDNLQPGGPSGAPEQPLSQRLHKPSYNPRTNAGAPTPVRHPTRHDALSGSPRSALRKGVVGGKTPMMQGPTDPTVMNRNAPSSHRRSNSRGSSNGFAPRDGTRDGNSNEGLVNTPRLGGNGMRDGATGYGRPPMQNGEAFERVEAKVHGTKLSLDPTVYADGSASGGLRRTASGGSFARGGPSEVMGGPNGPRGMSTGSAVGDYICKDCNKYVKRGDTESTFCEANGNRHF